MEDDLTFRQADIIYVLSRFSRPMNSQEISEQIGISRPTAMKEIRELQSKGWLRKVSGRRYVIRNLEKAKEILGF